MVKPIIVGVGQHTFRPETVEQIVGPFDAMKLVVESACNDAGVADLARRADALHVVNMFSWSPKDAPTTLAEKLGANPAIKEYTAIGGNTPQWLVNRAADNLAAGKCKIAVLAGCEVMHSLRLAGRSGVDIGAFSEAISIPMVGIQRDGTLDVEMSHGADLPVRIYPLLETALRAKQKLSLEAHRQRLGQFGESFSKVASQNPYAWFPVARTAEEIVTVTPKNRMLGYPYTRYLNSELYVDQAAAVIVTTPETAKELGIPESKWVYVHGGQDAHDSWFVSHRPDLADSPAIKATVSDSLAQAERSLDEIAFFDFYSCFPVMPFLTQHVLGIPDSDPRPRTLTGGLPFFGGPGNNYVMHSIAEVVERCRREPDKFGMVTSNGYYATKHGVGVYGASAPTRDWARTTPEEFQKQLTLPADMAIDLEPSGRFTVDAYTIWHDRQGEPEQGILCGHTEQGKRAWGRTPVDPQLFQAMMTQEWVGKIGTVRRREGSANIVDFS